MSVPNFGIHEQTVTVQTVCLQQLNSKLLSA